MRIPDLDVRTKKDLIEHIAKVAPHYTPEWRFDPENPDLGAAFALTFVDMFEGTVQRFNRALSKNYLAFLNTFGMKRLDAEPAQGYVAFRLSPGARSGSPIDSGLELFAEADNEEGFVTFTTQNDLYVTPAMLQCIFSASDKWDSVDHLFEWETDEAPGDFYLFDAHSGHNLQRHELIFGHEWLFDLQNSSQIELRFENSRKTNGDLENAALLSANGNIVWMYYAEEGWTPFSSVAAEGGRLLLDFDPAKPFWRTELQEREAFFVKGTVVDLHPLREVVVDRITAKVSGQRIKPAKLYFNDLEQDGSGFYPFGQKLSSLSEFYLTCNEVFCKKGARVEMEFVLEYHPYAMDNPLPEQEYNWRLIMRRQKLKKPEEYKVEIERVVWEYWNGKGWASLFLNEEYETIFRDSSPTGAARTSKGARRISFLCPPDMEVTNLHGQETRWIRVRTVEVANEYKNNGFYQCPYVQNLTFSYAYPGEGVSPDWARIENNLETLEISAEAAGKGGALQLFRGAENGDPAVYLGFDSPPVGLPIKMLFYIAGVVSRNMPILEWEYSGPGGEWKKMNLADETQGFNRTGVVTFTGHPDMTGRVLFGRERCWIRITNPQGEYDEISDKRFLPRLKALHLNCVRVIQKGTLQTETFYMAPLEEAKTCRLENPMVADAEVWVEENGALSEREMILLELVRPPITEWELDENGNPKKFWVKWTEVDDFVMSQDNDRHYLIDRTEGHVTFGNGKQGKLPPHKEHPAIKVRYRYGGGRFGNVEAHKINRMGLSIGYVSSVGNPLPTFAGCDQETVADAMTRGADLLRHRDRAVTARDFEVMAKEASRNIIKNKCLTGISPTGERQPGAVTLIYLPADYGLSERTPGRIGEQVRSYLLARCDGALAFGNRLQVMEPLYIRIAVKIEVLVEKYDEVFSVRRDTLQGLEKFFDPQYGNFNGKGWEIGEMPNRTQIYNFVKIVPKVIYIRSLFVSAYRIDSNQPEEVDYEWVQNMPHVIPLSGNHQIIIEVQEP